jgi:hypothetical protein
MAKQEPKKGVKEVGVKEVVKHRRIKTNDETKQMYIKNYWDWKSKDPSLCFADSYARQKKETPNICAMLTYRRIIKASPEPKVQEPPKEENGQVVYPCGHRVDKLLDPGTGECPKCLFFVIARQKQQLADAKLERVLKNKFNGNQFRWPNAEKPYYLMDLWSAIEKHWMADESKSSCWKFLCCIPNFQAKLIDCKLRLSYLEIESGTPVSAAEAEAIKGANIDGTYDDWNPKQILKSPVDGSSPLAMETTPASTVFLSTQPVLWSCPSKKRNTFGMAAKPRGQVPQVAISLVNEPKANPHAPTIASSFRAME